MMALLGITVNANCECWLKADAKWAAATREKPTTTTSSSSSSAPATSSSSSSAASSERPKATEAENSSSWSFAQSALEMGRSVIDAENQATYEAGFNTQSA